LGTYREEAQGFLVSRGHSLVALVLALVFSDSPSVVLAGQDDVSSAVILPPERDKIVNDDFSGKPVLPTLSQQRSPPLEQALRQDHPTRGVEFRHSSFHALLVARGEPLRSHVWGGMLHAACPLRSSPLSLRILFCTWLT
jgi:hypothetical protein